MSYEKISGIVSETKSNSGIVNFEIDGKPITILGLLSNPNLNGHTVIVAGKNKESGFKGIGLYDKTSNVTYRSFTFTSWMHILIGILIMLIGLAFINDFILMSFLFFICGGFYIWRMYIVTNKYINSLKIEK